MASFTLLSRLPAREVEGAWLSLPCSTQTLFGISLMLGGKKKSYILCLGNPERSRWAPRGSVTVLREWLSQRGARRGVWAKTPSLLEMADRMGRGEPAHPPHPRTLTPSSAPPIPTPSPEDELAARAPSHGGEGWDACPPHCLGGRGEAPPPPGGGRRGEGGRQRRGGRKARDEGCGRHEELEKEGEGGRSDWIRVHKGIGAGKRARRGGGEGEGRRRREKGGASEPQSQGRRLPSPAGFEPDPPTADPRACWSSPPVVAPHFPIPQSPQRVLDAAGLAYRQDSGCWAWGARLQARGAGRKVRGTGQSSLL